MSLSKRKSCTACEVLSYTFPRLCDGKSVFVEFYQIDPLTGRKRRKRYYLNHFKSRRERNAYASQLIAALNHKLSTGWNVWVTQSNASQYGSFEVVKKLYITLIKKGQRKNPVGEGAAQKATKTQGKVIHVRHIV